MAIRITLQNQRLDIYNLYRKINRESPGELQLTQLFAHATDTPTIICRDFNAHHPLLSSPTITNQAGEHEPTLWRNLRSRTAQHRAIHTYKRRQIRSNICHNDNQAPYKMASASPLVSDHFATMTELEMQQLPPIPPPPPRWNQDLANWVIFRLALEEWAAQYTPPEDIDQLEKDLVDAIHNAANKAMPIKTAQRNYSYKDSWYYCQEVRQLKTLLNRVTKIYRRRATAENRELLQTVKNDVHQRLQEIRIEKWLEWTKSNNLSPETRRRQDQLAPIRWEEVNEACFTPDDTDTPYTVEELRAVYKTGKDTAPGADRITYTMISNMGPAGENAFLRIMNKTHAEHTRPQTWRQQDTKPIPKPKDPDNLRPIALVSCMEKTGEKMVLNRITYKIGPLHKQLYAYQQGVGTTECLTDVLSYINQGKAVVVFIDFEKALS
ncbi:uncharacterized protein [Macrobrachium rosenbergii]|uniref:uncharacterized protein n=1 Tax=Macrobrachium rosenbergii TaxID=79674 RepID=UPI0034D5BBC2